MGELRGMGAKHRGRLTNLTQLSVDTSWYVRYRRHQPRFRSPLSVVVYCPYLLSGSRCPQATAPFLDPTMLLLVRHQ
jgi:hypothetical protein